MMMMMMIMMMNKEFEREYKGVEGNGRGIISGTIPRCFLGVGARLRKPQSKEFLFQPRFQMNISRIQVRNVKDVKNDTVTDTINVNGLLNKIHKCLSFNEVFLS
jgi:hypothetical protein